MFIGEIRGIFMINYFGFIDETGVLTSQSDQRFFALGLLKIEDTSTLYEQLAILKNQCESKISLDRKFKKIYIWKVI